MKSSFTFVPVFLLKSASLRLILFLCIEQYAEGTLPKSEDHESVIAGFKRFIESPPKAGTVIYKAKLPPNLGKAQPIETGIGTSTNYQYNFARWSTDAAQLRPLLDPHNGDEVNVGLPSVWKHGNEYWLLEHSHAILWIKEPRQSRQLPLSVNPPETLYRLWNRKLSFVLNMGIYNIFPGTARWTNDSVYAFFPEQLQTILGELHMDENGFPSSMEVLYQSGSNRAKYVIHYSYQTRANNDVPEIPSIIRVSELINGNEVERDELTVETLVKEQPSDEAIFDPRSIVAKNKLSLLLYTNSALYALGPEGRLHLTRLDGLPRTALIAPSAAFFSISIFASFAVLVIAGKYAKSTNKNDTEYRL